MPDTLKMGFYSRVAMLASPPVLAIIAVTSVPTVLVDFTLIVVVSIFILVLLVLFLVTYSCNKALSNLS